MQVFSHLTAAKKNPDDVGTTKCIKLLFPKDQIPLVAYFTLLTHSAGLYCAFLV